MSVNFAKNVIQYLDTLSDVLIKNQYFSQYETSYLYVEKLIDYCTEYIPLLPGNKAPERFKKYGNDLHYLAYRANKRTTWYIFYIRKDNRFIVTYITNNHVNAHHIRGLK